MITVVVSVYNTGKYLPKAMDCLLRQTYRDYEIIIVDDGSTDGSQDVCDREAQGRDNVRVFHKPNGGLSSARNFGIDHAKGDYIIFPDPDDWVELNYLEKLVAIREETGADLSICGHFDEMDSLVRIWNQGAKPCVMPASEAMEVLMTPSAFCGYAWNKLYDLRIIRANNLRFDTDLGMVQDLHFAVRYFRCIATVAYDPTPLYHYNHDSGGVTASYTPLTPRKLSGLLTYEKIAAMTEEDYPAVAAVARSTLCHTALQYIYIYYRTHMKDDAVLRRLRGIYRDCRSDYQASPAYTPRDKMFMGLVSISPRLYAFMTRLKKIYFNRTDKKQKAAWHAAA